MYYFQRRKSTGFKEKKKKSKGGNLEFDDKRGETQSQNNIQKAADDSDHSNQLLDLENEINNSEGDKLPLDLKNNVEKLSGEDMSDVKVTYDSSKPAQLKADAFAAGQNIHIAPGKEKSLPHEAWHVVQQKQNKVKPTSKLENGEMINDNSDLEKEADSMGKKAIERNEEEDFNVKKSSAKEEIYQFKKSSKEKKKEVDKIKGSSGKKEDGKEDGKFTRYNADTKEKAKKKEKGEVESKEKLTTIKEDPEVDQDGEKIIQQDGWKMIQLGIADVVKAKRENTWLEGLAQMEGVEKESLNKKLKEKEKKDGKMKEVGKTETKLGATLAKRFAVRSDELYNQLNDILKVYGLSVWDAENKDWEKILLKQTDGKSGDYMDDVKEIKKIIKEDFKELHELQKQAAKYKDLIGSEKTVLTQKEIDEIKLEKFSSGAHAFITEISNTNINGAWGGWGRKNDRNFVTSLDDGNSILAEAQKAKEDPFAFLETALGFNSGELKKGCPNGIIYQYIIEPKELEKLGNVMIANGKESSAFASNWIAGGLTEGGKHEATIAALQMKSSELKTYVTMKPVQLVSPEKMKELLQQLDEK